MPPDLQRRGVPLGRVAAEPNVSTAPHTPVPPPNDTAPTARPPAPDRRPPPLEYARPRPMVRAPSIARPPPLPSAETDEHTLVGPPIALWPPPAALPSPVPPATVEAYERALARKGQRTASLKGIGVLLGKFLAAATGLAAALTVTVQLVNAWLEPRIKSVEAKQQATDIVVKPAAATAASADKSADACRDWARAYDDYNRQVLAKAGIIIPQRENADPVTPIELDQTPLPKAGKLTGAPLIRIKTKPPPLP